MQKVIVERPRWGSRFPSLKTGLRVDARAAVDEDYDSGPRRAPARRHEKELTEHLQPLWRFLRSNLGRPWSKVYSEIREQISGRGVLGNHLLDHLGWEVTTNCYLDGKRVMMCVGSWADRPVQGFYVHPKSGTLREAARRRYRPRALQHREVVRVDGASGRTFERLENIWYETSYEPGRNDEPVLASKRQCASKQVRQIELWIERAERGKAGFERDVASVWVKAA